ncbi:MAG: hypothetical protein RMI91_10615 [Gemmatales bacterium]|nr:hypothetical protein [Gemmatales bacterium]MDW7995095.1 hypothetical protein [Gemmatales bacterium]
MTATLVPTALYKPHVKEIHTLPEYSAVALRRDEVAAEAAQAELRLPKSTMSVLLASWTSMLIGMLAASGAYLHQDWTSWLAATPLIGTITAIVGTWLSALLTDADQ